MRIHIKKIFILLVVFCMSINSFAAAVSDNDGSAFISKAEYDSLKNSFQANINEYNTSIDDKLNDAIYAYIAAASPTSQYKIKGENLIELVEKAWDKKIYWTNAVASTDTAIYGVCANISRFCMQFTLAEATKAAVGTVSKGWCDTADHFLNGYLVLRKEKGKITSRVLYRPLLSYASAYFYFNSSSTSFGASMSTWSSYTHWGDTQKQKNTKYWVGYGNNYQDMSTSFGWRTVTATFSPTEKTQDFIMAPNANFGVSVWDVDNETPSTSANGSYNSSPVWTGTKTGGTNSSSTVIGLNDPLYSPDYTASLPWVTTGNAYNEQILNLNNSSVSAIAMKYGLPLLKASRDCTFKGKIAVEKGKFGIYVNTPTIYDNLPAESKFDITSAKTLEITIELKKGDIVYVIYLPEGDVPKHLDVKDLSIEYEA